MEASQLVKLAEWFTKNIKDVEPNYLTLVSVLQNNSQQPNQQPVTAPLKELSLSLAAMPTSELSTLELRVLNDLGVAKLIGKPGREWINHSVRATTYDPATTFQTVEQAHQKLNEAKRLLNEFKAAAENVGIKSSDLVDAPTPYIFNVIFQKDVAIKNTRDFKKAAADWEAIISGVTAVADERSEDVAVVGMQNGSIIVTLSAPLIVLKILAMISKSIASIANDYIDFQTKREELRRSKMMSDAIEVDLKRQEEERRLEKKTLIIESVKNAAPNKHPEQIAKLEKAIDKHISFSEQGGEVDFILPPQISQQNEDKDLELTKLVEDVRGIILEYRSEVQKMKQITQINQDAENLEN